jgi:hypothetical protein
LSAKLLDDFLIKFEAKKRQPELIQTSRDLWQRKAVLHHVEQYVAAAARAVEVDCVEQ